MNQSNLAFVSSCTNDYVKATAFARTAHQIIRQHLDRSSAAQSERQQLQMAEHLRGYLDNYLSFSLAADSPAELVYSEVLASKGAVSARRQAIARLQARISGAKSTQASALCDELARMTRLLSNRIAVVPQPGHEVEYCLQLTKISANIEKLERELAAASEDFRRDLAQRNRTVQDIQNCLPARTMLVDLLEYTHCTPPGKTGTVAVFDAGWWHSSFGGINRSKESNSGRSSRSPSRSPPGGYSLDLGCGPTKQRPEELRRLVWDKLQPQLSGAKTVLISPDGATRAVPLAGTARSEAGKLFD